MKVRPESAVQHPKKRQRNKKVEHDRNQIALNESHEAIDQHRKKQEQAHQIKSQNWNHSGKTIDKTSLVIFLLKLEVQKMGFSQQNYKKVLQQFVLNHNFDQIELKNIKQWVLSRKSQFVELVLTAIGQRKNNYLNFDAALKQQSHIQMQQKLQEQKIQQNIQIISKIKLENQSTIKIQPHVAQEVNIQQQYQPNLVCPICLIETNQYLARDCEHIFCNTCLKSYIQQNINQGTYIVECPQYQCTQKITNKEAKSVLNHQKYLIFTKFKHKVEMQTNPNNKFCTKPDCGSILVQSGEKLLFCEKCKVSFCVICQQQQHPHQKCNQVPLSNLKKTYENFNIKKCPNCQSPIQKIDGCNHITCKKCKNEFCWICLQKYTPYHYRIYNCCGCPGLQFQEPEDFRFRKVLQILFFIFLPVLIFILIGAIILGLPFYMIFTLFSKPFIWIQDYEKCQLSFLHCICCCLPQCLLSIIGYFLLFPRSVLYSIFISPIKYFIIVTNLVCAMI